MSSASESSSSPSPVAPNAPKFGTLVPNRIFVGGISASTTEAELQALFSNYGCVKATKIISDRAGVSKGYGFVTFETEEEARRIQEEAENIVLKDRKLNIAPAIKKQPFARVYNSAQVVPNGTIMYHNGMPYTYNNGMAYFTPQDNTYQYSPQTQTATATYPLIYSAPTVFLPPHHYQYHAAGPGVPAHYLYAMPPATSTTTSASTSEMYHYTTAATGSLNTSSMQQIAYVASGSTSDYSDGSRAEGSEGMKMSKKAGGNNGSGYGSPRKSYNTLRNGTRQGNNSMAGGDVGASRTVKQIQGQQPHLVAKTVNGVTVMAYPTPIMVTAATPIKDHSSGDHEIVTGEVGIMHQLGAAAHPLTPPHTPVGSDTCEVMRKLQGLAM